MDFIFGILTCLALLAPPVVFVVASIVNIQNLRQRRKLEEEANKGRQQWEANQTYWQEYYARNYNVPQPKADNQEVQKLKRVINALIAKAKSTNFPAEKQAFIAKANALKEELRNKQ